MEEAKTHTYLEIPTGTITNMEPSREKKKGKAQKIQAARRSHSKEKNGLHLHGTDNIIANIQHWRIFVEGLCF